jgi:CHASE2 domain-containing sensor protein
LYDDQSPSSRISQSLKPLVVGLLAVAFLIIIKIQVEDSSFGHWFNARGYEVLHSFLANYNPDEDPSVVVLDISDLKLAPDDSVPNESLRELVSTLLESGAKAIAIDINFAPRTDPLDKTGARADNDPDFFEFLHTQNEKGAHVFVGVHKVGVAPEEWLGMDEDKDLAADMTIMDEDTTEIPAWLQCGETKPLCTESA